MTYDPAPSTIDHRPSTTVVLQTAFLGDVILTTPLLSALADLHGPVDIVTTPAAAALVETHPAVRRVVRHDKRGADSGAAGVARLVRTLRAERYARAYLPHRSWRSGLAALLAGIPERIGFSDAPARATYTRRVVRSPELHETERLVALAGDSRTWPVAVVPTRDDVDAAAHWLLGNGVADRFIAIAPGSVWATKVWDKYTALAAAVDCDVVVMGGPEDAALGARVAGAARRGYNAAGSLSLRASAALLSRAAVLISNDSAPLHLAQATGTPVVAAFGPTVTSFGFGPRGPRDRVVEVHGLRCRPCSTHGPQRCPLRHHRCMVDLELAVVLSAVNDILRD